MLLQLHMLRNFQNKQKPKENKYFMQSHRTHSKITLNLFLLIEITVQEYPGGFRLYSLWYLITFQKILADILPSLLVLHWRSHRLLASLKPSLCGKLLIPLRQTFTHFSEECSNFLIILVCFWFTIYILKISSIVLTTRSSNLHCH